MCLLVARRGADGTVTVLDKLKDTPRLRDEIGPDGLLSEVGAARTLAAMVSGSPNRRLAPVTSRNASSMPTDSTSGENRSKMANTWRDTAA